MFRSFNLGSGEDERELARILNSPKYVILKVDPYISDKGTAGVLLRYKESFNDYTREKSRYRREILSFYLERGGKSEELDDYLTNKDVREIQFLSKFTEEGPVVILDFETKQKQTRS